MRYFKTTRLAAVAGCLAALGALAARPLPATATLTVVTTTTDMKSVAEAVGGDRVKVTSIATGYEDPHFVAAKPSFMMIARDADLWIAVGMELEIAWEGLLIDGSRNPRIRTTTKGYLDASLEVMRLEVPQQKVTREMGDVHPLGNPHYWLDPFNMRIVAKSIADRLAELDPAGAVDYRRNAKTFQEELDRRMFGPDLVREVGGDTLWVQELKGRLPEFLAERRPAAKLAGWRGRLQPFQGRKILTYHRSWVYLAQRFGLIIAAELEPRPGVPPSPAHLAKVVDRARAEGVKVILQEPFYERKASAFVAARTGATVLVCADSVGGEKEAADYFSLIDMIVGRLAAALGE